MPQKNRRKNLYRFNGSARNLLMAVNIILPLILIDCYCAPGRKYTRPSRSHHTKDVQQDKNGFTVVSFSWGNSEYKWNNQDEYLDDNRESSTTFNKSKPHAHHAKKVYRANRRKTKYCKSKKVRKRKTSRHGKKYTSKKGRKTHRTVKRRTRYYRVRKGDCLISIARKFGISLKRLRQANSLRGSKIRIGKRLKIPAKYKAKAVRKARSGKTVRRYKSPGFIWPAKKIYKIKRDGQKGVKSIGIFIITKAGARVRAAATGIIKKIGVMRGYGKYIIVKHKNRYLSVYSNLKKIYVSKGQKIKQGRIIGKLRRNGNKLHFLINCAGKVKDPRRLVKNKM